jgi:hypothetical protein
LISRSRKKLRWLRSGHCVASSLLRAGNALWLSARIPDAAVSLVPPRALIGQPTQLSTIARSARDPGDGPLWTDAKSGVRGHHWCSACMHGVDDLSVIDPAQVDRGHAEIGMPQLPLDDRDRDPFARHLHRVSMPELSDAEQTAGGHRHERPPLAALPVRRTPPTAGPPSDRAARTATRPPEGSLAPRPTA